MLTARGTRERLTLATLAFVWRHRFITARQLYRAVDHVRSYRTAQHHLQQLVRQKYLATVPIRAASVAVPKVYVVAGRGRSMLAAVHEERTGRTWPTSRGEERRAARGYGLQFIEHELFVTDVDISVAKAAAGRDDVELLRVERRYNQRAKQHRFEDSGREHIVQPDAGYFVLHRRGGRQWLDLCWLEADRGTMRPQLVHEKFRHYDSLGGSTWGERYLATLHRQAGDTTTTRPTFRLLVICESRLGESDDTHRLAAILAESLHTSRQLRDRLWLTTREAFTAEELDANQPIWIRGRDVRTWLPEFRRLDQTTRVAPELTAAGEKRRFIFNQLARMPRYTLLPPRNNA